ncbi:CapA family protein [bacterium]|nr:CapA family protein [bacterium]
MKRPLAVSPFVVGWVLLLVAVVTFGCRSDERFAATNGRASIEATTTAPSQQPPAQVVTELPPKEPKPIQRPSPTPLYIPPTPTPLPVISRTLVFTGDVLSHTPVIAQALRYGAAPEVDTAGGGVVPLIYDYRPMFAELAPRLDRADLAICVLETPVSADNIGLDGYPTFEAPRELPDALAAAGYDGCSTASNHSFDRNVDGIHVTLDQMDRVGLGHAGMARSAAEAATPRIYDVDGVAVAHLSYTYSLNGFRLPEDQPWLVNLNEVDAIVDEATRAREAGADLVVLSIQWGNEYQRKPSAEQLSLAVSLTGSGMVDLIMGNHVHVVQPVAVVNDVPVVYGLGNSLSNQSDNCCRTGTQDGVLVEATVIGNVDTGYRVSGLAFAPTWVDRSDYTIVDLLAALDDPDLDPSVRLVYERSFERTVEAMHLLGWEIPLAAD